MIETSNIEKFKQLLKKEEGIKIVRAQDDLFNRKALEYGKFDVLLGIENLNRKMTLRQLDSGLNPFLASIMAKHGISLGIDLETIRALDIRKKGNLMAQIAQNVKLCRKERVKLALFGVKDKKDAYSLLQALGASSQQTKEVEVY